MLNMALDQVNSGHFENKYTKQKIVKRYLGAIENIA